MTHARFPDFSQPVPIRRPVVVIGPQWRSVAVRPARALHGVGELLAAVAIIAGGIVLTGLAALL